MTPQALHELLAELRSEPVCGVETAARALGLGRTLAHETIRETGELAGVKAIRVGRRIRIPTRPILERLGYDEQEPL